MTSTVTTKSWNEAVQRQFPGISIKGLTGRVTISKVSPELLEIIPSEQISTDLSGFYTNDVVCLHDKEGEKLLRVDPERSYSDANDMSNNQDGESIGDAIARLKVRATEICFISRYTYYSPGQTSSDSESSELEIFKAKDFDFAAWLREREAIADGLVQETIETVSVPSKPRMNGYIQTINGPEAIYIYHRATKELPNGYIERYGIESLGGLHLVWPDGRVRSQPIPLEDFDGIDPSAPGEPSLAEVVKELTRNPNWRPGYVNIAGLSLVPLPSLADGQIGVLQAPDGRLVQGAGDRRLIDAGCLPTNRIDRDWIEKEWGIRLPIAGLEEEENV